MMKEKTMRVGLIAVAAFVLIGMLFVPAVAAYDDPTSPTNPNYDGSYSKADYPKAGITTTYNDDTKTLYLTTSEATVTLDGTEVPVTLTELIRGEALLNEDVKFIDVAKAIDLANSANLFSLFTNVEGFNYFGTAANLDLFGPSKPIYKVIEGASPITVTVDEHDVPVPAEVDNGSGTMVPNDAAVNTKAIGESVLIDTCWAFEGQQVKVAVKPLQNFGVYGWDVYAGEDVATATLLPETDYTIEKSRNPEDSATTYIFTMLAKQVALIPKLRDSGSTIVSYVFLNADTYVLEIPADFSLKGFGESKAVAEKYVELTGCDLLAEHKLTVKMDSENGYNDTGDWTGGGVKDVNDHDYTGDAFTLKSVKNPANLGAYIIGMKKWYPENPDSDFALINGDEKVILDTADLTDEQIYEKLEAKKLKTELEFILVGINPGQLGKYKDKLTFTVEIGNKEGGSGSLVAP